MLICSGSIFSPSLLFYSGPKELVQLPEGAGKQASTELLATVSRQLQRRESAQPGFCRACSRYQGVSFVLLYIALNRLTKLCSVRDTLAFMLPPLLKALGTYTGTSMTLIAGAPPVNAFDNAFFIRGQVLYHPHYTLTLTSLCVPAIITATP